MMEMLTRVLYSLQWRHNGRDSVSNHQPHDCLLNRLFRHTSKKTSKLRVTGLCVGKPQGTGEFPAQMASNAENFPFDDVIMYYCNMALSLEQRCHWLEFLRRRHRCIATPATIKSVVTGYRITDCAQHKINSLTNGMKSLKRPHECIKTPIM